MSPSTARPVARRHRVRSTVVAGAALALLAASVSGGASGAAATMTSRAAMSASASAAPATTLAHYAVAEPVQPPAPGRELGSGSAAATISAKPLPLTGLAGSSASYGFLGKDARHRPAHFNRCSVVNYRVNYASLSSNLTIRRAALADVQAAMTRLGRAAGFAVHYSGTTTIVPFTSGWSTKAQSGGAQVYVGWSDANHVSGLAGSVAGVGGSYYSMSSAANAREPRIVFGGVVLDKSVQVPSGFRTGVSRGTLLLHELGHVANLNHVADRYQVMYPTVTSSSRPAYQRGDQNGLNTLRAYPCF